MYRIAAILLITLFCSGCAGVSKTTSSTWGKTKSLFGLGGEKPERKITVDTYPSRTVVSTQQNPNMEVKTQPEKVEVEVLPPPSAVVTQEAPPEQETERADLSPEERRLQEEIDETVKELRKKHSGGGLFGIFK